MTYEQMAIVEALRPVSARRPFTEEELRELARLVVEGLHRQHYRLISDGTSFDD